MNKPLNLSITNELVSATSALNTEVTYNGPHVIDNEPVFISTAEPLVDHSITHIHAAFKIVQDLRRDIAKLRASIYKREHFAITGKLLEELEAKL